MPNWTKEQNDAITTEGTNIIVSAGAGSGKTAVLTARVINKLLNEIKINELIILTFTNAAAKEMKDRIRKEISKYDNIKDNLELLDSAYITTFDSYTLSLVKKYHYILNVSSNISILDNSVSSILKKRILDEVMDEMYEESNSSFIKLINDFTIKNDNSLKETILNIIKSLELKFNKEDILNNYMDLYLNENKINEYINEFNNLLLKEINSIESNIMALESMGYDDYYNEMVSAFDRLIKAKDYDEIRRSIPSKLPRRPRNSGELVPFKDSIDDSLKKLNEYLRFNDMEEIKESFNKTKDYIVSITEIIKRYNDKLNKYKYDNDLYEFTDIEIMAIKLLQDNPEIREEIKNNTHEILVDEYQDTNDLQEEFVSLISNNNVYMVGDIKQSIYGFRNANPEIFKNKYDEYSKNNNGIKIDLLKNFRSRDEVLKGINEIFSLIMDLDIGGADYIKTHQMEFGNNNYIKNKASQNYNLDIINYNYEDKTFSKEENEAFIIGKDILNKVKNKYQVVEGNFLRYSEYKDFCIIMDRGTYFSLYKKVFEYLGIPLTIYEDKKLTNEIDIMLLNNIVGLILKINKKEYDTNFKYYLVSILRSYLFEYSDDKIFSIIKDKNYSNLDLYTKCLNISKDLNILNSYELLVRIIDDFEFYNNTIKVGNIEDTILRVNNLLDISKNLSSMGYTIEDFKEYLEEMIKGKDEIKYTDSLMPSNSVKIMNIHKSKGLEFPICYYALFAKEFNKSEIKERIVFDNKYGLVIPYFDEGLTDTILKDLLKNKYNLNSISEKIRLLYVALTRAREKMIIVTNLSEEENYVNTLVDYNIRLKYNSFLDIMNSIKANLKKYIYNVDLSKLGITKDYLYGSNKDRLLDVDNRVIHYNTINIDNSIIDNKHASKVINKLITKEVKEKLEYGNKIHKLFEIEDFLTSNNELIKNLVKTFNINNNTLIYKEHEFVYENNNTLYHGVIDLVLIDKNVIKIIDYKLKDITDDKYKEQLKIYYDYINMVLNKNNDKIIEVYLYSIIDNTIELLNFN